MKNSVLFKLLPGLFEVQTNSGIRTFQFLDCSRSHAQLVVRVLPIAIRVPLLMGSSSHGGKRKGQLGPGVTVPMSGLPPEGYPEGSRRVWTPHYMYYNSRILLCVV